MIGRSESLNLKEEEALSSLSYARRFKDLAVYQKAFSSSLEIHQATLNFPKTEQYGGLADQMRRASKGICANLAEGFAKQQGSKPEFKRFVLMAIGSAHEMQVWIDYTVALNYADPKIVSEWAAQYDEIVRMLQSLYSKA